MTHYREGEVRRIGYILLHNQFVHQWGDEEGPRTHQCRYALPPMGRCPNGESSDPIGYGVWAT